MNIDYEKIIGQKFSRWTVISSAGRNKSKQKVFNCKCECGNEGVVVGYSILKGVSKSCGCYRSEYVTKKNTTHGHSRNSKRTPEYWSWQAMRKRCYTETQDNYKYYGGRGITVCDRWLNSFKNFIDDMGPKPTPSHSLDRIDNDGSYSPENCRWTDQSTQTRNRRVMGKTSKYRGVHKKHNKFTARIRMNGKAVSLGLFEDELEAAKAYQDACEKYLGYRLSLT